MQADVHAERPLGATGCRWEALRFGAPAGSQPSARKSSTAASSVDCFHELLAVDALCHHGAKLPRPLKTCSSSTRRVAGDSEERAADRDGDLVAGCKTTA